jgi:hypothetical protein
MNFRAGEKPTGRNDKPENETTLQTLPESIQGCGE